MGVSRSKTTAYHPQTDGLVENFNLTLKAMIAKHAKTFGSDWNVYLRNSFLLTEPNPTSRLESHHFISSTDGGCVNAISVGNLAILSTWMTTELNSQLA